jgi:hypothetical protein
MDDTVYSTPPSAAYAIERSVEYCNAEETGEDVTKMFVIWFVVFSWNFPAAAV